MRPLPVLRGKNRHWSLSVVGVALALCFTAICCSDKQTEVEFEPDEEAIGPVWFEDVTDEVGLDFVHDPGPTGTYFTPQSVGSGCAFLDFDGDGLTDIYLLHNAGPDGSKNRLFRQYPKGTFRDVSDGSGLDVAGHSMGVAVGDANNDGLPDLLLTQYGGVKFFLNRGGRFEEMAEKVGLVNPLWGASAAFFDYDLDGWLDVVVINYLDNDPSKKCFSPRGQRDFCGPTSFDGLTSKLFHNDGSAQGVKFTDVSLESGIARVPGKGFGVVCADFNGDEWPDIFVSNDGQANRLWINQKGDGTFKDQARSHGVAYNVMGNAYAGMGVAVGDTNNSGLLDLFVTHLDTETHTLWRQINPGEFRDHTVQTHAVDTEWRGTGWGTVMADFDLDGDLDIAIANGRVYLGGSAKDTDLGFWETYADRNQLLINDGDGNFRDISTSNEAFCGHWNVARGLAQADFDEDGAPDLLVTTIGGKARLFRNVAENRGHWLKVRAFDPTLNREAYGAEVRVKSAAGEQLRVISPAESFLSSSASSALFGLGAAEEYESIRVKWPGGVEETFPGGEADRPIELRKSEGL